MRVCIDTNVLLRLFGTNSPLAPLKLAVVTGQIEIVVSNDILLEYEEVVGRLSGQPRWQQIEGLLVKLSAVFGNVLRFDPQYHFHLIAVDPDDNKFADCAIAAEADFIVTSDGHFAAL